MLVGLFYPLAGPLWLALEVLVGLSCPLAGPLWLVLGVLVAPYAEIAGPLVSVVRVCVVLAEPLWLVGSYGVLLLALIAYFDSSY